MRTAEVVDSDREGEGRVVVVGLVVSRLAGKDRSLAFSVQLLVAFQAASGAFLRRRVLQPGSQVAHGTPLGDHSRGHRASAVSAGLAWTRGRFLSAVFRVLDRAEGSGGPPPWSRFGP